jgi:hypothetical protein
MGFFGLFKGRTKRVKDVDEIQIAPIENTKTGKRIVRLNSHTERLGYIKENCELILESERQVEEAKAEYQAVTSYLTDMQRIDMIPIEQRDILEDSARTILNLTKERNKLRSKSSILSDMQYRLFERYELQIPKDLPVILEGEQYQAVIQQDIAYLERERTSLDEEQEDIISKQGFLKGIAITTCVIVLLLFGVFAVLSNYSKVNFILPFLLTVLMGMVGAMYIFMEARKNSMQISLVQLKLNRQIMLMNKVKIKSVNNRNYLDYTYNKYMVDNYEQLKSLWEEYIKIKDEAKRYQSNTELLDYYHKELIKELKKFGIKDAEIWIYQPSAIIDSKEMVEVRHRLNVRRQKLRERIDSNVKQKVEAMEAVKQIMKSYPDCMEEANKLITRYRIQINE